MNSGRSRDKRKGIRSKSADQIIDASPGDDPGMGGGQIGKPRNVAETQAWKGSLKRMRKLWDGYLDTLKNSFASMTRVQQMELITKGSLVVTIGVSVVSLGLFYYFLPTIVRVFALPLMGVTAWFVAVKLVAPMVADRLSRYLNDD